MNSDFGFTETEFMICLAARLLEAEHVAVMPGESVSSKMSWCMILRTSPCKR